MRQILNELLFNGIQGNESFRDAAGGLGSSLSVPTAIFFSGFVCLVSAETYFIKLPGIRKLVRPIYESMGILLQIARGVEQVTNPTVK